MAAIVSRLKSLRAFTQSFAIDAVGVSAACGSSTDPAKKDVTPATVTAHSMDTIGTTASPTTGYLSTGLFTTQFTIPIRVYFNFTGSFAAVTNNGGWVDIVR